MSEKIQTIIGSVFVEGERTKAWYELQMQFIRKTTNNFRHLVFLNGTDFETSFFDSEIVGRCETSGLKIGETAKERQAAQKRNHWTGLSGILEAFNSFDADNYLILDCDCFPIQHNWVEILQNALSHRSKKFVAPIRTENFDLFPHPSAVFFKRDILSEDWFDFSSGETVSLLGKSVNECGGKLPIDCCLPLLRTNVLNLHPIFSGIYGDIFYHHGCGSRPRTSLPRGFCGTIAIGGVDHWAKEESLYQKLIASPETFVQSLRHLQDRP